VDSFGGGEVGERETEGQKVFHFRQEPVSRIRERTVDGGTETWVSACTAKDPLGPYVGVGIAGTREDVTGLVAVIGALLGG